MSLRRRLMLAVGLLGGLANAAPAFGADQAAEPLRLCADPTNPPFSSDKADAPGIYMELGAAIGRALNRPVEPVWEMTYYGKHATRETLLSGKCDMFVGLPASPGFMGPSLIRSRPFLSVGFALVSAKGHAAARLSDLRGKRVAVQLGTPPQSLLAVHDEITTATFLDPESAMQALADGQVDAAFVWGPSAGYVNHTKLHDGFAVTPIAGQGMQYQVAVGFSRKDAALRDQVDQVLAGMGGTVAGLAAKYGFPAGAPVELSWAPAWEPAGVPAGSPGAGIPFVMKAGFSRVVDSGPGRLPIVHVVDTPAISDDQQGNVDYVAAGRGPADNNFKPASGAAAAAEGRTIFNGTCNHCHGPDAIQAVKKINLRLLQHRYGGAMDTVFHFTVTHGRESKGMPNWSGVFTEDDFAKILAFLHTVQDKDDGSD